MQCQNTGLHASRKRPLRQQHRGLPHTTTARPRDRGMSAQNNTAHKHVTHSHTQRYATADGVPERLTCPRPSRHSWRGPGVSRSADGAAHHSAANDSRSRDSLWDGAGTGSECGRPYVPGPRHDHAVEVQPRVDAHAADAGVQDTRRAADARTDSRFTGRAGPSTTHSLRQTRGQCGPFKIRAATLFRAPGRRREWRRPTFRRRSCWVRPATRRWGGEGGNRHASRIAHAPHEAETRVRILAHARFKPRATRRQGPPWLVCTGARVTRVGREEESTGSGPRFRGSAADVLTAVLPLPSFLLYCQVHFFVFCAPAFVGPADVKEASARQGTGSFWCSAHGTLCRETWMSSSLRLQVLLEVIFPHSILHRTSPQHNCGLSVCVVRRGVNGFCVIFGFLSLVCARTKSS